MLPWLWSAPEEASWPLALFIRRRLIVPANVGDDSAAAEDERRCCWKKGEVRSLCWGESSPSPPPKSHIAASPSPLFVLLLLLEA